MGEYLVGSRGGGGVGLGGMKAASAGMGYGGGEGRKGQKTLRRRSGFKTGMVVC